MMLLFACVLFAGPLLAGSPAIDRAVPDPQVNYAIVDIRTRQVLAVRWSDIETPVPVGSLVKPFTALAYGTTFPELKCNGRTIKFAQALSESCNGYFLQLARSVRPEALDQVAARYSIPLPANDTPETLIGLGTGWRIPPLVLLRAYAELSQRSGEPAVVAIVQGLSRGATMGTSKALGSGVLAKTGTAPCVLEQHHAGDGFSLVLDPADAPNVALLVRVHNVPGSVAAKTAAQILRIIRSGK
jgi:cell division protein FtsI/penicillin-binding protein 2